MTVKERVFKLLQERKNEPVSGQEIAQELGCTRAAVWKAVKTLIDEGCEIDGVNNKGYTLRTSSDAVSGAYVCEKVEAAGLAVEVRAMKTVDSTNNLLKQLAGEGLNTDCVVISEEQTAGRGRRGRSFYSPKDTGIYISFLLHPHVPVGEAAGLTTVAAVAVAKAIEKVSGQAVDIKWVNDIWMRGKKVAGILTEASTSMEDGSLEYAVVGIGINLYEPQGGFPEEIKEVAGAVFTDSVRRENCRNEIAVALIEAFFDFYSEFPGKSYLEDYRKRCFVIGREVSIITPDHDKCGDKKVLVLGVNDDCHLHVRFEDGHEEMLSSGEISIKL